MNVTRAQILRGAATGAAGMVAFNAATYADMLLRGRAPNHAPAQLAGALAECIGLESVAPQATSEEADHRRTAIGALLGYCTGVGLGVFHSVLEIDTDRAHPLRTGVVLGLMAMAASDISLTLTGVSDLRQWSPSDWVSDLVPHLAYGIVTSMALDG